VIRADDIRRILADLAALRGELRSIAVYLARAEREREEAERADVGRHAPPPWRTTTNPNYMNRSS